MTNQKVIALTLTVSVFVVTIAVQWGKASEKIEHGVVAKKQITSHEKIEAHPGALLTLDWLRTQAAERSEAFIKLDEKVDDIVKIVARIEQKVSE